MNKKYDLTQGSILKGVTLFAIPLCIGNILQQLYNTADALIIGNFCDTSSLAAVGTSSQPVEIILCLFMGLSSAVTILVSQCVGSGDKERLKKIVVTAVSFLYICSIILTIVGILLTPFILKLMQVQIDAYNKAVIYVTIVFLGTLGNLGYNINAGILRGVGDSRSTLKFLFVSSFINIILDLLFVGILDMDVAGAALATTFAMYVSWLSSIIYIRNRHCDLNLPLFPGKLDTSILKELVSKGVPLGLNSSIYSFGHLLIQSLVNMQGTTFVAGFTIATKLTGICKFANAAYASAATTFAGQNKGACNYPRLKKGVIVISFAAGIIMFITGIIGTIFSRPILSLFTDDPLALDYAVRYIWIVLPTFWTFAVFSVLVHYTNGIGVVKYPTIINLLMLWAIRIPVSYAIDYFYDGTYFMFSMPINYIFGLLCMFAYFIFSKQWKEVCNLAKNETCIDTK